MRHKQNLNLSIERGFLSFSGRFGIQPFYLPALRKSSFIAGLVVERPVGDVHFWQLNNQAFCSIKQTDDTPHSRFELRENMRRQKYQRRNATV